MYALKPLRQIKQRDDAPVEDHVVHLHRVSWADYERLLAIRGEKAVPRLTYLEGTLELMSPSLDHEIIKSVIGRLVEVFCLERGIRFSACGSWTLKDRRKKCGAEADECYILFGEEKTRNRPHIAIEVIWTSGSLDKLDVYRKLGVPEVWVWRKALLRPFILRGGRYVERSRSELLPDLDLGHLVTFLDRPTQYDAIRDYRASLAGRPSSLAEPTPRGSGYAGTRPARVRGGSKRGKAASARPAARTRSARGARTSRPRARGDSGKA